MARIVFMGSPRFALPTLERLSRDHSIVGVVTQPDRPAGRGRKLTPSAVKLVATEMCLPVITPETLRSPEPLARLAAWDPEVVVVAAFGQILRQDVLDLPPHGCLNVHASLLPRWRGAAPVAAAILAGDTTTGVTIMRMDAGLDTGPILAQQEEPVRPDDTRTGLEDRLALVGAGLVAEMLSPYLAGDVPEQAQPEDGITLAPRLRKEDGRLDWSAGALELDRRVRAVTPWPGAFTSWKGKRLKVLAATPLADWQGEATPGTVVQTETGPAVATGKGALLLGELQLAGKRPLGGSVFVQGRRDFVGSQLAAEEA